MKVELGGCLFLFFADVEEFLCGLFFEGGKGHSSVADDTDFESGACVDGGDFDVSSLRNEFEDDAIFAAWLRRGNHVKMGWMWFECCEKVSSLEP